MLLPPHLPLILLLAFSSVGSMNVDLRFPLLFHDLFTKSGSHFGASLALLRQEEETSGWLLVGAPKADSVHVNYSGIHEPGLVWKCSVGTQTQCSILELDAVGEMDVKVGKVARKLIHKDRKTAGMLGGAMDVGGDRFVTCASRWVNQKYTDLHLMNGLCYWLSKEDLLSTNASVPDFSHRLVPLLNSTRQAYNVTKPNGSSEHRFDWAFGQAGFSVHMTERKELLIGAPGVLEWAGTVVEYRDGENVSRAERRFNAKLKDSVFAQVRVARAQSQINNKVIGYFDYFGYAVTSGQFLRSESKSTQYAAGAPRGSSLGGKVLLFSFPEQGAELRFLTEAIEGTSSHFASYFGSVLGALDVNGDGLDDLLVGAPLFEDSRPRSVPASSAHNASSEDSDVLLGSGDEGCVFVYLSLGHDFGRDPQQICGESRPGARFGSAISPLDINQDGFQDAAIGAPYESDGRGAVYIYVGSSQGLVLAQKLSPEGLGTGIRGFGYALSAGVDIDRNGYPDLAVGAYASNHVVVYRAVPLVQVRGNLSSPQSKLRTGTGIFPLTSCLSFQGKGVAPSLDIWVRLSVDTEIRKTRVVEMVVGEGADYAKGVLRFRAKYEHTGTCYTFNLTTVGDLDSVTLPVTIKQEFWLEGADQAPPTPLRYDLRPSETAKSLPLTQAHPSNPGFDAFAERQPLVTRSGAWETLSIPIGAICEEDGEPSCLADLSLKASFRTPEGDVYGPDEKFVIGSAKSLILQVELSNARERANLPLTITVAWPSSPTLRNSRSDCSRVPGEGHVYSCTLPTPLNRNKREVVELELDMWGVYADRAETLLTFNLTANSSSALLKDPSTQVHLPLLRRAHLLLLGQTTEASYYDNITAHTLNFTHVFQTGLMGQSPVSGIKMQIQIPGAVRIDGVLLPLLRIREPTTSYEGVRMTCRALNGSFHVDPLHISYEDQDDVGRRRREVSKRGRGGGRRKSALTKKPLKLSCLSRNVECFRVECEALLFKPVYRALVEFRLRLLTETARLLFAEQDREVFVVESVGRAWLLGGGGAEVGAVSQTLVRSELATELKAWILIVASGSGLVLLASITILLTQCGFFRRRKLEELQALMQQEVDEQFVLDEQFELDEDLYDYAPLPPSHLDHMDHMEHMEHMDHLDYLDYDDIYHELH